MHRQDRLAIRLRGGGAARTTATCAAMLIWAGCGDDSAAPTSTPTAASAPGPVAAADPGAPTNQAAPADVAPSAPPVDLLDAVPAAVAVSSVYRDHHEQVNRIADGDVETAWNSRSDDLVGAWIEVRLPEQATVSSIEMTAGFTKADDTDLFTGNHRIQKVRILRDGTSLGEFPLDVASRGLQTIPVAGGGGVYRIEVAAVQAGERDDWREVCVSELRVMGRANGAGGGPGAPAFAVGTLPALPATTAPIELATPTSELRDELGDIFVAACAQDEQQIEAEFTTGDPDVTAEEIGALVESRRELFERVARLIEPGNAERAADLRRFATENRDAWAWEARRADVEQLISALDGVAAGSGNAELECEWAKMVVALRLSRMDALANWVQVRAGADEEEAFEMDDDAEIQRAERAVAAGERLYGRLEPITEGWSDDEERRTVRRILNMAPPGNALLSREWAAVVALMPSTQQRCGW